MSFLLSVSVGFPAGTFQRGNRICLRYEIPQVPPDLRGWQAGYGLGRDVSSALNHDEKRISPVSPMQPFNGRPQST
jgi:hypothetical protein